MFNLSSNNNTFTNNNSLYTVSGFYTSSIDAENEINSIPNPASFQNTSPNQIIYARIQTQRGCYKVIEITLSTPSGQYNPIRYVECSNENSIIFSLNNSIPLIESEIEMSNLYVEFFATAENAITQENTLEDTLELLNSELPTSIFARAETPLGCQGIVEVILDQAPTPQAEENTTFYLCSEENSVSINSGVIGDSNNYTFLWENGETTSEIEVFEIGTYEVNITQETQINGITYSCTITNIITVVPSEKATISYNLLGEFGSYQVEVLASGTGNYSYAIDNLYGPYYTSPIFNVQPGKHTIYVKDENGCGISSKQIYVIGYMKFFTPNQDGNNDTWRLLGIDRNNRIIKKVIIFDRFGKILQVLSPYDSWNGTYNGNNLPSNDYWFMVELIDGSNFKSHFTLKR